MKIKKLFFVSFLLTYTLLGYIPAFRIKYASAVDATKTQSFIEYFIHNLLHNWIFKVIVALAIAMIVNFIVQKVRHSKEH